MNDKLKASCPVCGRTLFKATNNAELECNCPKCKSYLTINLRNNSITITVNSVTTTSAPYESGNEYK